MSKDPTILITGSSGAVGPRIVDAFYNKGYRVRVLAIDEPQRGLFPDSVEVHIGDVTDYALVRSVMRHCDLVVHLAALLHRDSLLPEMKSDYESVNIGGTRAVIQASLDANIHRVVYFSSIAVYGQAGMRLLNESSPALPETYYAQSKLAAEKIVLNARGADGEPIGAVLRLGAVYGSRVKGNYERMVRALAQKRFLPVGDGFNKRTLVYDKDVAQAAVLAIEHPAASGRVYNVTDGEYHTLNEIIAAICAGLGRKPPRFSLPVTPTRLAVGIVENAVRLCGFRSSITKSTIDKYTEGIMVDSGRIQRELGFVSQYDLYKGWQETIQEMRIRGVL